MSFINELRPFRLKILTMRIPVKFGLLFLLGITCTVKGRYNFLVTCRALIIANNYLLGLFVPGRASGRWLAVSGVGLRMRQCLQLSVLC